MTTTTNQERDEAMSVDTAKIDLDGRQVLLFASYCGDDNPECSPQKPCPICLGMSNVFEISRADVSYARQLAPEWNITENVTLKLAADYLDGMADNAKNHGHVNATSFHAAYEQGVREAAEAIRRRAARPPTNQEHGEG